MSKFSKDYARDKFINKKSGYNGYFSHLVGTIIAITNGGIGNE